mmetsp:Transcript_1883/g.6717  ORF Transcript_1883/g.6717 Transcript_1883/m.6717 type:complete len:249 (+) Transcript_1883:56-802(+)
MMEFCSPVMAEISFPPSLPLMIILLPWASETMACCSCIFSSWFLASFMLSWASFSASASMRRMLALFSASTTLARLSICLFSPQCCASISARSASTSAAFTLISFAVSCRIFSLWSSASTCFSATERSWSALMMASSLCFSASVCLASRSMRSLCFSASSSAAMRSWPRRSSCSLRSCVSLSFFSSNSWLFTCSFIFWSSAVILWRAPATSPGRTTLVMVAFTKRMPKSWKRLLRMFMRWSAPEPRSS